MRFLSKAFCGKPFLHRFPTLASTHPERSPFTTSVVLVVKPVSPHQATIEQAMEKRSKDKFGPLGGKQLVIFLDDFNMPMRISHESPFQPPLELLRFWIDYGGW